MSSKRHHEKLDILYMKSTFEVKKYSYEKAICICKYYLPLLFLLQS